MDADAVYTGTVKFYNELKGFGFIKYKDSEKEIFVHTTGILEDGGIVHENDEVEFTEAEGDNGKGPKAINVRRIAMKMAA